MYNRSDSKTVLLVCCISFAWTQISRAVLYSVMPAVSAEIGLDPGLIGVVTGALYGGYAAAVLASGLLPCGRRAVVSGGFVLSVLGNIGFALAHSFPGMLTLAIVSGVGAGLYVARGAAVLAEAFRPQERGRAMGWHELSATVGLLLASLYVGAMLQRLPWRAVVLGSCPVGLVAAAAFWRRIRDAPERGSPPPPTLPDGAVQAQTRRPPLDGRALALAGIGGSIFMIIGGFPAMLPTIVHEGWGVLPAAAATFAGWIRAGGLAGHLFGGWLADRFGRIWGLVASYLISLPCLVAMGFMDYGFGFGVTVLLAMVAASAGSPAYYALMGDTYSAGERERIFGPIAGASSLLGTVVTPVGLGYILNGFSAPAAMVAMAAAPTLGLGTLAWYTFSCLKLRRYTSLF